MAKGKIFISYRRRDSGFASVAIKNLLLYRYLHEDQLFMDLDSIRPGEPFPAKLAQALSECNLVLAIIGRTWLDELQQRMQTLAEHEEDFVRLELATSLARNRPIIPVLLDGAQMPNPKDLPPDLQALTEKNAVDIGYRTFDSDIVKLVKGLRMYEVECSKPPPGISGPKREQRDVTTLIARVHGLEALCSEAADNQGEALLESCMQGLDNAILDQDGYVSRDIGSRIAAFFGAPDAHHDDPERACSAALQMRDWLKHFAIQKQLPDSVALSLSVGVDVGLVTSGNVGPKGTFGVVGTAATLADELHRQADPGEILISDAIAGRCGNRLSCTEARALPLSHGRTLTAHPLNAIVVDAVGDFSGGLIGREDIMSRLQTYLDAPDAQPWIEISGPMGIGKTALVRSATSRLERRVIHVLASRLACRRPLGFIRQLMDACMRTLAANSLWRNDLDAFEAALESLGADVEMFAEVLWPLVAADGGVEVSREDPATRRRRLERGLIVFLEALGQNRACLLWLDSFELADADSADILESIARADVPNDIQCVVVQRTDARSPVFPQSQITLSGLSDVEAGQLLALRLQGATLPQELSAKLLERAEGVPLFIEEMVQSMRESGTLDGPPVGPWRYSPSDAGTSAPLPPSIRAAMTSRLDSLSKAARMVLCEASIQGAEFQPEVIRRLHQNSNDDGGGERVDAIFAELQGQGLIESRNVGATELLAFCNPMMEDVCYEQLVAADRKSLHEQIAGILRDIAGSDTHVPSELLAYHYESADLWRDAAEAYMRAGDSAAILFVNAGAANHYRDALLATAKVKGTAGEINRMLATAHERLAALALRMGDYALSLRHATELCQAAPSSRELAEGYRIRALATRYKGEIGEAEKLFEHAISKAGGEGDAQEVLIRILMDFAEFLHHENRPAESLSQIDRMQELTQTSTPMTRMQINILAGKITRALGRFEESKTLFDDAYREAMMDGTKTEIAKALINRGIIERDLGNYGRSEKHFVKALETWKQVGDEEWMAGSNLNIGMVALSIGDYAKALDRFTEARDTFVNMGNVERVALAEANFAFLYLEQDKARDALACIESALKKIGTTRGWLRGLVQQLRGDANLQLGNTNEAAQNFEDALAEFKPEDHPEVAAGCIRGLGRVAFRLGHVEDALAKLTDAADRFEALHRKQEAGRTLADVGKVCATLGKVGDAAEAFARAIVLLESIKVPNDLQRVKRMLSVLPADAPDTGPCAPATDV